MLLKKNSYFNLKKKNRIFCEMQGFGEPSAEHWLGNDIIHKLTTSKEYSLHIQLKDREGNEAFSRYDHFYIDGEESNYRWSCLILQ